MKKYICYILFGVIVLLLIGGYIYGNNVTISSDNYLKLYEKVIDQVIASNSGQQYDYIAIDANSFNVGSVSEQQELVKYLSKYNKEVVIGSYNILSGDSHFLNDEGKISGIIISASNCKYTGNMVTLSSSIQSGTFDNRTYSYKATFMFNSWNLRTIFSPKK